MDELTDQSNVTEVKAKAVKRKVSLIICESCGSEEAKYRCPGCLTHSCSLPCVKRHKLEVGCNGMRDKVAFVPLGKFNEMNLLSDYRFLEDVGRLTDGANRDDLIRKFTSNKYLNSLRSLARKYSVHLKLLPIGFTKRKENSTMFHKKAQVIFWHLKLIFVQSQCEFVEKRVSSSRTLSDILGQYIHPTESDPVFRQRLKIYALSPCNEVEVFMKAENRRSDAVRYYKLDPTKSLIENLKNKTIIEYPTLHIVLKDQASRYLILGQEITECCETSQTAVHFKEEELEEGELRDDDC